MALNTKVQLIIPTSINVLTAVHEQLITRQRAGLSREIELPSLRRRALLIAREVGVLPVQNIDYTVTSFTR